MASMAAPTARDGGEGSQRQPGVLTPKKGVQNPYSYAASQNAGMSMGARAHGMVAGIGDSQWHER